jgi:hypothetical protein
VAGALRFSGEIWYWRGPSPFYFVTVPDDISREIHSIANEITYGWGMVAVSVTLGGSTWRTSLWPKDGRYVVPIRKSVRDAEGVDEGHTVAITLELHSAARR